MLLLIDNYDSFVQNLARYCNELGCETHVVRNDVVTVDQIAQLAPEAVILSPGPCTPHEAGVCLDVVRQFSGKLPMLGVCLGHQVIGAAFGASVVRAPEPVHGRTSRIYHDNGGIFAGLPNPLRAMRYHSLVVDQHTLPPALIASAHTQDGTLMGLRHREHLTIGTQFHPESILTDSGHQLLRSFLNLAGIQIDCAAPRPEWQPESADDADWPIVTF